VIEVRFPILRQTLNADGVSQVTRCLAYRPRSSSSTALVRLPMAVLGVISRDRSLISYSPSDLGRRWCSTGDSTLLTVRAYRLAQLCTLPMALLEIVSRDRSPISFSPSDLGRRWCFTGDDLTCFAFADALDPFPIIRQTLNAHGASQVTISHAYRPFLPFSASNRPFACGFESFFFLFETGGSSVLVFSSTRCVHCNHRICVLGSSYLSSSLLHPLRILHYCRLVLLVFSVVHRFSPSAGE